MRSTCPPTTSTCTQRKYRSAHDRTAALPRSCRGGHERRAGDPLIATKRPLVTLVPAEETTAAVLSSD
jgi:hypothetical protein